MIAAVDIGGTKIATGIVDGDGKVRCKRESRAHVDCDYRNGLELVIGMLQEASRNANAKISGIGIGSTGPVDPFSGEFGDLDFLPRWRGKNLVKDLARNFNVPVALENDADAGALAEAAWGVGKGKSRLVYVTIGTGIGGGIILEERLYRGVDGSHPEIGHHVIDPAGPLCSCGFRGCWEALAAGPAMAEWLKAQVPADYPHRQDLTAKRICQLALEGDSWASQAVKREAYYLGLGLANIVNLFAPDVIALSGSVMKDSSLFLDGAREVIQQGCRFVPAEKTEIILASLGEDANLIGAARVWDYRFGDRADRRAVAPAEAKT